MKALLAMATITLLLTGCASTGGQYAQAPTRTDMTYVTKVEAKARAHGVGVIWVHPPRREVLARSD